MTRSEVYQRYKELHPNWREEGRERAKLWRQNNPDKVRESAERWRKANPERYNAAKREWAAKNRDKLKLKQDRYHRRIRLEALEHYSNGEPKCECCEETEIKFLAIDHINGNGNKHRKTEGVGNNLILWLRRNDYPEGYRVLCHNCNMAIGFYGECPHKQTEEES